MRNSPLGIGFFELSLLDSRKRVVCHEIVLNTLADEGQEHILKMAFQDLAQAALYIALHTAALTEISTMTAITGEPTTNGYARGVINRNTTDWTIAKNIAADETGTAQAGAAGTITLAATANATDDFYNDSVVETTGGMGQGQFRLIPDYTGSSKVANVSPNWKVIPDVTTTYKVHSDFVLKSKDVEFSASGGSWGPVSQMALVTVATGTAGKLISFASLAATQTPAAGESILIRWKEVIRSGA